MLKEKSASSQKMFTKQLENGIKAILRLVPEKYKMRLGNAEIHLKGVDKVENFLHPQADAVLLKEPDLYCFLLRCRKDKVEPLIE